MLCRDEKSSGHGCVNANMSFHAVSSVLQVSGYYVKGVPSGVLPSLVLWSIALTEGRAKGFNSFSAVAHLAVG